jgi:hypothetical protein
METLELAKKAFRNDDADAIEQILRESPELKLRINEPSEAFGAPVITCARSKKMLDVLLAAGADINAKSDWWAGGFGLLHLAELDLARYAVEKGAFVDVHAAARLGMLDRVKELVAADPSLVQARGGDGQLPLHFAGAVEIAEFLLASGADIDARDLDHESTAAQWMVRKRQDVAKYLVSRGCKTDILMATALGYEKTIKEILDKDPESIRTRVREDFFPMIGDKNGGTIYQWELGWYVSAHQVAKDFKHDEIFRTLMERSPDDVKLLTACWLGDEILIDSLLKNSPTIRPEDLRSLADAARNDNSTAVRLMIKAGIPVDAVSQHGGTPLHWACWNGNLSMVDSILAHNPPLEVKDRDFDGTPLNWACYASVHGWHPDKVDYGPVVERLIQAGSKLPDQRSGSENVEKVLAKYGVPEAMS